MGPYAGSEKQRSTPEQLRRTWVAARLNGVPTRLVQQWAHDNDLHASSSSGFERAVGPVRAVSELQGSRGRPGRRQQKERALIRDWLLVNEESLGLVKMVYRLPNDGMPQAELLERLGTLIGVRQVIETGSDREVIVIALVRDSGAARLLRGQLEDLVPGRSVRMDTVEWEDHTAAGPTWTHLARRA